MFQKKTLETPKNMHQENHWEPTKQKAWLKKDWSADTFRRIFHNFQVFVSVDNLWSNTYVLLTQSPHLSTAHVNNPLV